MLRRTPTLQARHKVQTTLVRMSTKTARDLSISANTMNPEKSAFTLPPLTPFPKLEESVKLLSTKKIKAIVSKDSSESTSRNMKRLTFIKKNTYTVASTPRNVIPTDDSAPYKNQYIDNFYPNGSDSKFPNNVPLPGDWSFNKKMYEDQIRYKARDIEARYSEVDDDESPGRKGYRRKLPLSIACSLIEPYGSVPDLLKETCLTHLNGKLYLYGGHQHGRYHGLYSFNLRNHHWSTLGTANTPVCRSGHSTLPYKDSLVVYGGDTKYKKAIVEPLHILHLPTLTWQEETGSGEIPIPRKNHGAAIYGKSMIIFGGQDQFGKALDSLYILDMSSMTWTTPHFTYSRHPPARFNCSFTAVFPDEADSVWDSFAVARSARYDCGFYLLGGEDEKVLSDMWVLKFTNSKCFWTKIEPSMPWPKTAHTACAINGMIAVIGGRPVACDKDAFALFLLRSQKWVHPQVHGTPPLCRWNHASTVLQGKILVFGGTSDVDFLERKIHVIETDQSAVADLINS